MSQSPPLENTGEHRAMGATAPGQGIKGSMTKDSEQRREYFGGDSSSTTQEKQQDQVGASISDAIAAADESVKRTTDKYKEDKERRF
ncbi:hypothetical protein FRC14_007558 [Serendipita sp. 396]|nr:hypothetical protein FRC14_007558 [Serendipita sp. 396]KAG8815227.1 hypothetical protein FRC19_001173 [Serendipita sp. 401]KAG8869679.1 hypothetical protein FRC20_001066 [Serendipita sp. 405]